MVKSLVDLCTAVCLRNIRDINDMGYAPYGVVRPILLKIDNAAQLRRIEINSPHLEGETVECWRRLIARDFPVLSERHNYVPTNPKSWHKIYSKYRHLDRTAKREAEEKLKNAFKEIKKEKDDNVSQVINYDSRKLPRLPRDVKPQVGIRRKGSRMGPDLSELRFTGGSRTKTNTPKSLLKRAIREAKEISTRNRLNTPTGAAQVRPGQIIRAPTGMVQEKVKSARPLTGIRPPSYQPTSNSRSRELEDREARLRKAKEKDTQRGGSYMDDEDLDDLDIEGEDDPIGLDVDDLEALDDLPEPGYRPRPSDSGSGSARGSVFARKMGSSSALPSTHTEAQTKSQPTPLRKDPSARVGPTSPPLRPTPSGSSATSPTLPPAAQRKRKAVDIFMRPKPKVPRT
ncbi:hypothetical protein O1611_g1575 [Lasiodiplodia mahajangana]|uniref:Uncharacterized protein n=1 Tax=Lasiodiplodia mahajangana TaxID=1108764 RepID=A0ACC2JX06_9PEZI|nr:hypothetical protein O1611_g1575 [Lasiodiplodia mahajangana]